MFNKIQEVFDRGGWKNEASNNEGPIISLDRVVKTYHAPSGPFQALKGVDLKVHQGEFLANVGKTGSGKSTLINIITGIDSPSSGQVHVASGAIHSLNQKQLAV